MQQFGGWQSLFYATLLLTLLLLPGALYVLPETESSGERSFDVPGGILLGLAAGLFLFGIKHGQAAGSGSASSWGRIAGSAVAAGGVASRSTQAAHPLLS